MKKPRILVFVVAYNAEKTIGDVLTRIPAELKAFDTEILVIDDSSQDRTAEEGRRAAEALRFPLTVLFNPVNQGYGGNQKLGFHYAIEHGFDVVALVHGDGQYAPERLPELLAPLLAGEADAVFGSRMLVEGAAKRGGMPFYKRLGNKILTTYQNALLGAQLSEFHSGYRLYSVAALAQVPFHLNTNDFHFDTEIIIQLLFAGLRIKELPIPTYYGDEICHVNGLRYAGDVFKTTFLARAQSMGIFYQRHFDVRQESPYEPKLDFPSPHTLTLERVAPGDHVLDLGCAGGYVSKAMADKGCEVTGVDAVPLEDPQALGLTRYVQHDLNAPELPVNVGDYDRVVLLDVIEHLDRPEAFVDALRRSAERSPDTVFLVSTGNVGFLIPRLMLLLGSMNYGKRGILDLTHSRLFTFSSLRRLFEQGGFQIEEERGVAAPFPFALGGVENPLSLALLRLNERLIDLAPGLFSYQMFFQIRARPSLPLLLESARRITAEAPAVGSPSEVARARGG